MSTRPSRPWPPSYVDFLGRGWLISKLDQMLADPEVLQLVQWAQSLGVKPGQDWNPGAPVAWAKHRYRREEVAALLLVLIVRWRDRAEAAEVGGRP